jgi:hypothetical protein
MLAFWGDDKTGGRVQGPLLLVVGGDFGLGVVVGDELFTRSAGVRGDERPKAYVKLLVVELPLVLVIAAIVELAQSGVWFNLPRLEY